MAIEAAWAAAHLVMYPLGLLSGPATRTIRRHNLGGLSPEQRGLVHHGVATAETPILLVHGIVDNHSIFTLLHRALRRRGFATVSSYDYGLLTRDVAAAAQLLGEAIDTAGGQHRLRARSCHRPQPRWPDRPVLRAAARW